MSIDLKYSCFDFDNNILHMDTNLFMERLENGKWVPVKVTPEEFVNIKSFPNYRPFENDWIKAFVEFSDKGERGEDAFIEDIKKSLDEKAYGPSYDDFIECVIEARIFAIITARSHKESTIRKGIEYIIKSVLSDTQLKEMKDNIKKYKKLFKVEVRSNNLLKFYLDQCVFVGVSSPDFEILLHQNNINVIDTPSAKMLAFRMFVKKVRSYSRRNIKIGFSDDDHKNIKSIKKLVRALELEYPKIDFSVFHTLNGKKDVS